MNEIQAKARERLDALEQRYAEHRKTMPDDMLDYGEGDPVFDAHRWVNPCGACQKQPSLRPRRKGGGFAAVCACGRNALPAKKQWQALLHWNKSRLSVHPDWRGLPFFYLNGLTYTQARAKLAVLREHLELRANMEGLRRLVGHDVGGLYLQRLKAYLAWCHYAQGLIREHKDVVK